MAAINVLYPEGLDEFGQGNVDLLTDNIKVVLVDLDDYAEIVSAATNASPIVVTTGTHGYSNGNQVSISGVLGNLATNGVWYISNVTATTFELDGSTGDGAYTSGGFSVDLSDNAVDDIPAGARVATSGNLASKTLLQGIFDAADITLTSVTGDVFEAIVIYHDSGVESTSTLIALIVVATGLPLTPNGGDVTVAWASTINRIFKL